MRTAPNAVTSSKAALKSAGGPVSRILSTHRRCSRSGSALNDHSSRPCIAARLQQPTRESGAPGRHASSFCLRRTNLPAYLVLLRVGFTMPPALLPARCALTAPFHPYRMALSRSLRPPRRYRLCGTGRLVALKRRSRALPGTLPRGVRTFLPCPTNVRRAAAIVRSACSVEYTCAHRRSRQLLTSGTAKLRPAGRKHARRPHETDLKNHLWLSMS